MKQNSVSPLNYDPFDGDFGSSNDVVFFDKMVVAHKEHMCFHCDRKIKRGESHRSRADKVDGEFFTYRWCADCCLAMVADIKSGNIDEMEKRTHMYAAGEGENGK